MNRTRDYYRHHRERVIKRKKDIIHAQNDYWHVRFEGELSKGKIHCSCPLCRRKSYDYSKMSDIDKVISMAQEVMDYTGDKAQVERINRRMHF